MARDRDFITAQESRIAIDFTTWAAVAYLMFPVLIFLVTWTELFIGLPLTAVGFWVLIKSFPRVSLSRSRIRKCLTDSAVPATLATLWVTTMGLWGFGFGRAGDWFVMRDDLLSTLFNHSWPVTHVFEGSTDLFVMRHYLAYYLPGPAFAKLLGLGQDSVLFITGLWTWLGVMIVFSLLTNYLAKYAKLRYAALVAFIGFSGLDVIGSRIKGLVGLRPSTILEAGHLEWWAKEFQYSSNTTLLHWVPQHALPGWIGALAIIRMRQTKTLLLTAPLILSSALLWSPFVFFGLSLVLLIQIVRLKKGDFTVLASKQSILALLFSGGLVTLLALYLVSGASQIQRFFIFSVPAYEKLGYPTGNGFILTLRNLGLFLFLEIGPYVVLAFLILKQRRTEAVLLGIILTLIPLYIVGIANDFAMRASVPALAVLFLFAIEALFVAIQNRRQRFIGALLVLTFLIGAITPAVEFATRSTTRYTNLGKPCIDTECQSDLTSTALRVYNWTNEFPSILRTP